MRKLIVLLLLTGALSLAGVGAAEARIFEPQANWWTSGQLCVSTRNPPGRRWQALPPRSCLRAEALEPSPSDAPCADKAASAFQSKLDRKAEWVSAAARDKARVHHFRLH
jgi:hypothetical protein